MPLDTPFAQELCDLLHAELGLVCSFMDADGHIVASSERQRLGSIHPIAQRIARGEMDEYRVSAEEARQSTTVREGINMGIDLAGRRLACFAIAGPLDVVRPLARIVCFCVTSLLQTRQEEPPALAPQSPGTRHQHRPDRAAQPCQPERRIQPGPAARSRQPHRPGHHPVRPTAAARGVEPALPRADWLAHGCRLPGPAHDGLAAQLRAAHRPGH